MSDPVLMLQRFVTLWRETWANPLDETHLYSEYFQLAEYLIASTSPLRDELADWLVCHLARRWKADNEADQIEPDDLFPSWAELQVQVFEHAKVSLSLTQSQYNAIASTLGSAVANQVVEALDRA